MMDEPSLVVWVAAELQAYHDCTEPNTEEEWQRMAQYVLKQIREDVLQHMVEFFGDELVDELEPEDDAPPREEASANNNSET